jgi:hypothetical protein
MLPPGTEVLISSFSYLIGNDYLYLAGFFFLLSLNMPLFSQPEDTAKPKDAPSHEEIRQKTYKHFGFSPCLWQIRVVEALIKHDKDIISISATGSGKTLTFWMPLLFFERGIQIIVSPLNILGKQNVDDIVPKGFSAIALSAETATHQNFKVSHI